MPKTGDGENITIRNRRFPVYPGEYVAKISRCGKKIMHFDRYCLDPSYIPQIS